MGKSRKNKKCLFCKNFTDDIIHLFSQCYKTKSLWNSLKIKLNLQLPELTPESAYLGFHDLEDNLLNHIHLIFKIAIYNRRPDKTCSIEYIIKNPASSVFWNHRKLPWCQKSEKTMEWFERNPSGRTDGRTHGRTYEGKSIGPPKFLGEVQK